jgi:ribosomal protein L23
MNGIFAEIGVEVTKENKQDVDKAIHKLLGVEYKNCSTTWKEVKKRMADDESGFMKSLDGALGKI